MDAIDELKQIKENLLFAVRFHDGLVVKSQARRLDRLIKRLSGKLNEAIVNEANREICACKNPDKYQENGIHYCDRCGCKIQDRKF